jgi:hypothetical protein
MNQIPTAMRAAFRDSFNQRRPVEQSETAHKVFKALARKVGVTTRKTMWSVQRGNR